MIIYSQELKTIIDSVDPFDTLPVAPAQPLVLAGIPYEQPNPSDTRVLRSMALYLSGIHQVTVNGI
jgi:hypothetical protein